MWCMCNLWILIERKIWDVKEGYYIHNDFFFCILQLRELRTSIYIKIHVIFNSPTNKKKTPYYLNKCSLSAYVRTHYLYGKCHSNASTAADEYFELHGDPPKPLPILDMHTTLLQKIIKYKKWYNAPEKKR